MTGPRYIGWRHTRVVGDRGAAQPYRKEAEKLLGFVAEDAARNGLQTHSLTRKLADGAVITGEIRGGIPRVTIVPPSRVTPNPRRTVDGFFLSWGSEDVGRDPVMFEPPPDLEEDEDGWRDWRALFFSSESFGYADTPEDRRGASYVDVFGVRSKSPNPERMPPSNGTWTDRRTGETVAWLRCYPAYWPEHYRHPRTLYGNWVTIYGHPVLILGGDWRVMAAAKRDGWLYFVVAEDLGVMSPPALPASPAYSGQVWCSQPYSNDEVFYALWRVPLALEKQPDTGIETYRAIAERGEMLWRGALRRAYGAWSFDAEVTEVVTVQLPRLAVFSWVYTLKSGAWVVSDTEDPSYPTVEAQRIALTIDHGGTVPTVSYSASLAPSLIAEEDGVQLEIKEHTRPTGAGAYGRVDYVMGDFTIPVTEQVNAGGVQWYERRVLMFAHLPSHTLLFHRWRTDLQPIRKVSAGYQLFVGGEEVEIDDPSAIDQEFAADAPALDMAYASNHHRMMGVGYDDGVGTSWFRPMDAMSFLLGWGFQVQGNVSAGGSPAEPGYGFQGCPHIGFSYSDQNYVEHSAAGGYVFGSVGGEAGHYWGTGFTLAEPYGANAGSYQDPSPGYGPMQHYAGTGAVAEDDVLVAVGHQPMTARIGTGLGALAIENRALLCGTRGDARTLLEGAMGAPEHPDWRGFYLGHTGKPRMAQRGFFYGS